MEPWITLHNNGAKIYHVGGFVRDKILGTEPKDQDILICNLLIPHVLEIIEKYGKVEFVGKSFCVVKYVYTPHDTCDTYLGHDVYDIAFPLNKTSRTSLNIEKEKLAKEKFFERFDPFLSLESELQRRDFTINAIAEEFFTGNIIDPFNGKKDLKNRTIRMISQQIFDDDPLRILRAAQLASRLEFNIESKTLIQMKSKILLLDNIPKERIMEELVKTLMKAKKPSIFFNLLLEIGALQNLFPSIANCVGVTQNLYHAYDVYTHTMKVIDLLPKELELRLAGLYHDTGKNKTKSIGTAKNIKANGRIHFYGHEKISKELLEKELCELRFSSATIERAAKLVINHLRPLPEEEKSARRFISKIGVDLVESFITLKEADAIGKGLLYEIKKIKTSRNLIMEIIRAKPPFTVRDLAINGSDLLLMGFPEGPLIGKILKKLLEHVLKDPACNTKENLIKIASFYIHAP